MPVFQKIQRLLGLGGSPFTTYRYRCTECDAEFESETAPHRIQCPDCLSATVMELDDA